MMSIKLRGSFNETRGSIKVAGYLFGDELWIEKQLTSLNKEEYVHFKMFRIFYRNVRT